MICLIYILSTLRLHIRQIPMPMLQPLHQSNLYGITTRSKILTVVYCSYTMAGSFDLYMHCDIRIHVTLSHLRSKESTGIHKPCILGLFPLATVRLKVDQRVQRNNFPGIHLNVHQCTSECISGKLFL